MESQPARFRPRTLARIGGVLYLIVIVLGLFGEAFVRGRLVVPGDPHATGARIMAMEPLWRVGLASEFVLLICAIVLLVILYVLLRPVSRDLALLAVVFNTISIAIEGATTMSLVEALFPLGRADYLQAIPSPQREVMTMLAIRAHDYGFGVALIFFGCFCLVAGHLIAGSGYMPKAIGVLMQIAGVCYLANSFALLLSPPLANALYPYILLPPLVGESSLCVWLMVKGVDTPGWNARQTAPTAR